MRERRVVTILFSDLSGFTRLSERMDPEDVADTVDALFHRFRAAIEAVGGTVDKFIGDAVMAVFGAPLAHADDPARAVRAGLALQRELAAFNRERGLELAMRVGVNTGEVLWGSVGGSAATAMGDAVNVAQRLEGAAPRGGVLVSTATRDTAGRLFRFEARGEVALKGREGAVGAHEAVEEVSGQTEHVEGARGVPLVGREAELEALERRAAAGRGAFVAIRGEAGVGKSRLAAEFRSRMRRERKAAWVGVGRAYEGLRAPLGPLAEVLRAEAGVAEAGAFVEALAAGFDGDADARRDAASLLALSVGVPVPGSAAARLEPERAAEEAVGAWVRWLRARTRSGPALLCLEDLHWADEGTRQLLAQCAVRLAREPIVVLVTSRPGPPLPAGFEEIALGDLAPEDSLRLAAAALGPGVPAHRAQEVVHRAGGHPYFVEELARAVREGGAALPDSLLGALVARLDREPAPVREALKAASAFGRAFWPAIVSEAARLPAEPFEEALRHDLLLVQPSSLVPGERQLAFRHALLRDAAYSLLPRKDRQRLHASAAAALEARTAAGGRRLDALSAEQLRLAGDEDGAAARWNAAAAEAERAGALGEAAEYLLASLALRFAEEPAVRAVKALCSLARYAEAVRLCDQGLAVPGLSSEARLALHILAATAEQGRGRYEDSLARLSGVAEEGLDPVGRLRVLMARLSSIQLLNRWDAVEREIALAEKLLDEARSDPPSTVWLQMTASLWNMRGIRAWHLGRPREALACYERSAEFSSRAGHVYGQSATEHNRAMVLIALNRPREAIEACDRSLALRTDAGMRQRLGATFVQRAIALDRLGRDAEARRDLQEAIRLHREAGDASSEIIALATLAELDASSGRRAESLRAVEDILALAPVESPEARAVTLLRSAIVLDRCGETARALPLAAEALEIRERLGARRLVAATLRALGRFHAVLGRTRESDDCLDRAETLLRDVGDTPGLARALGNRAEDLFARGELHRAEAAGQQALSLSSGEESSGDLARLHATLARIQAALGRPDEAARRFDEALRIARAADADRELADALEGKAETLLRANRVAEARAAAEEGLRQARGRGDAPRTSQFEKLLARMA
ncbi:MAG: tetratricopeptide repeat protein [Planctomycetia bacterium]|nr:tetratricopeptide repeat protein [Planctomycetia bacterium]